MLLFVQLVVTSVQKILGVLVALYSPQHNKVYEINAFYTVMFSFFHFSWPLDSNVPYKL